MFAVGRALGFGVLQEVFFPAIRIAYVDVTATQEVARIAQEKVNPVLGLEYYVDDDPYQEDFAREHFEQCREVGRRFGRELSLTIQTNPALEDYRNPAF